MRHGESKSVHPCTAVVLHCRRSAVLCCAVLCCAVLCCAVLCVLCYALLLNSLGTPAASVLSPCVAGNKIN
eukprot:COSAG06_NODE_2250_length_7240_cov_7.796218_2_plen_71_part_00